MKNPNKFIGNGKQELSCFAIQSARASAQISIITRDLEITAVLTVTYIPYILCHDHQFITK
jgi:hypothetical protein